MNNDLHNPAQPFRQTQAEFSNYIRDPDNNQAPADVALQRMQIYRELFFNNINSFLSSNFPVLHSLMPEQHWLAIAQDFFQLHSCKTPYFSEIPEEFLNYLQHTRQIEEKDPPFMLELAHYEWVEMALSISPAEFVANSSEFLQHPTDYPLQVSELAWPLIYQYPVQRISPDMQPTTPSPEPNCLVVYRNAEYELHFLEISPLTYRFLDIINNNKGILAKRLLQILFDESAYANEKEFLHFGNEIIHEFAHKEIICAA